MARYMLSPQRHARPIPAGTTSVQLAKWRVAALRDWRKQLITGLRKFRGATIEGFEGQYQIIVSLTSDHSDYLARVDAELDCVHGLLEPEPSEPTPRAKLVASTRAS